MGKLPRLAQLAAVATIVSLGVSVFQPAVGDNVVVKDSTNFSRGNKGVAASSVINPGQIVIDNRDHSHRTQKNEINSSIDQSRTKIDFAPIQGEGSVAILNAEPDGDLNISTGNR